jgi:hypothetical protein
MKYGSYVFVSLVFLASLVLSGCVAREAMHPISSHVVPDYDRGIRTIGLLPIAERHGAEGATLKLLPAVEQQVAAKTGYVFMAQEQVLGRAQQSGVADEYRALVSAWQADETVSGDGVVAVGKGAGVDALLFIEVYLWAQEWVQPNAEGASTSAVGMKALLYSAKNGEKLWEASDEQTMKSANYSPESGIGVRVDTGGLVRASSASAVPEPPPIEEVVNRVVGATLRVFP